MAQLDKIADSDAAADPSDNSTVYIRGALRARIRKSHIFTEQNIVLVGILRGTLSGALYV